MYYGKCCRHYEKDRTFLKNKGIPSPRREAEELMCHYLQWKRLDLYMKFDMPLKDSEFVQGLRELVQRRGNREPLSYIIGNQCFTNMTFCRQRCFVPKTGHRNTCRASVTKISPQEECFVADIGCGTGCIGLSIAAARSLVKLYAVDISPAALACTRKNIAHLQLEQRVGLLQGDLLNAIPAERPIDYLVSNPPYIPSSDIEDLEPEVRDFEPRLALDGGQDGLDIYKKILQQAQNRVQKGIFFEVGIDQADMVAKLIEEYICDCPTSPLHKGTVEVHEDLANIPRVVQVSRIEL